MLAYHKCRLWWLKRRWLHITMQNSFHDGLLYFCPAAAGSDDWLTKRRAPDERACSITHKALPTWYLMNSYLIASTLISCAMRCGALTQCPAQPVAPRRAFQVRGILDIGYRAIRAYAYIIARDMLIDGCSASHDWWRFNLLPSCQPVCRPAPLYDSFDILLAGLPLLFLLFRAFATLLPLI